MPRDLRRALDEEPDDDAPAWKPKVDDEIVGCIVLRDQIPNKFKPETPTERLIIDTDDEERRTIYGDHAMLRSKIQKLNPQVGDWIAIRRLPDDPEKKYTRYKVVVEHATGVAAGPVPDDDIPF